MTTTPTSSPVPRTAPIDLSAFELPHPNPFVCDLKIDPSSLSRAVAHVTNTEFVRWVDRVAELHSDSLGYTRPVLCDLGIMWFVARHEIDYRAEAWPQDELVLATWVRTMDRVKSWRETLIVRPADRTVICRAATLWVLVNLASRRPTRVSAEMVTRFEALHMGKVRPRCTSP